jgi:hypothetical protein
LKAQQPLNLIFSIASAQGNLSVAGFTALPIADEIPFVHTIAAASKPQIGPFGAI